MLTLFFFLLLQFVTRLTQHKGFQSYNQQLADRVEYSQGQCTGWLCLWQGCRQLSADQIWWRLRPDHPSERQFRSNVGDRHERFLLQEHPSDVYPGHWYDLVTQSGDIQLVVRYACCQKTAGISHNMLSDRFFRARMNRDHNFHRWLIMR